MKRVILKNYTWSLEPIVKVIGLMGISSPIIDGHFSCFTHFKRAFSFLLVASIQSSLLIHIFLNATNVSNSYIEGISTTALSWNFIIDNLNVCQKFAVKTARKYGAGGLKGSNQFEPCLRIILSTRAIIFLDGTSTLTC